MDLASVPFEELVAYDARHFLVERPAFLRCWIDQPEGAALGVLQRGLLAGYGVIRACRQGFRIGPLFADDEEIAEDLFAKLASRAGDQPVFLDTPEPNGAAAALAKRYGMQPVFETARMYLRGDPGLPVERIFGVTSYELG